MRIFRSAVVALLIALGAFLRSAEAVEVKAGGALNITISGFARTLAAYGDLDKKGRNSFLTSIPRGGDPQDISNFDFLNDTEVHILVRGEDENTGLQYGATIELEADTSTAFDE